MVTQAKTFRQKLITAISPKEINGLNFENSWHMIEANPGLLYLANNHGRHRLVTRKVLGYGFSEWLFGASYGSNWAMGEHPPARLDPEVTRLLEKEAAEGRFVLVMHEDIKDGTTGSLLPLFTLFKSRSGKAILLEVNETGLPPESLHFLLLNYSYVLASTQFFLSHYDADADFLTLGSPNIVQRHSAELVRKHIAQKVTLEHDLCNHCLRCVTSCAEMKAAPSSQGPVLLGPAEAYCTNCGLCQEKCPYIVALPKEDMERTSLVPGAPYREGEAVLLSGPLAATFVNWLDTGLVNGTRSWPLRGKKLPDHQWSLSAGREELIQQYKIAADDDSPFHRQLLITSISSNGSAPSTWPTVILRLLVQTVVVLSTPQGAIEKEMAVGALRAGTQVSGVVDPMHRPVVVKQNQALHHFYRNGALQEERSLEDLVREGAVDLVLTPFLRDVSGEVHTEMLERAGTTARVMAPQILQAFTFANDPLLNELRDLILEIFTRYPELMESEAQLARSYLADIDNYSAHIHARYRSMALASGHSACPTCAELQVLAVPIYMAIVFSLARGEIPEITFTCETGCMSETLNKVKEVAQKVRGGRTVFGGGFAFGEAAALTEELGIKQGWLPKQRRYVVSQSGDGGSVIGLPAWLNALRQKAFLVPQRTANVLHFINVTDTQVYSNTGGESSASSMLGMGTLTTPIGQFLLGNQRIQWNLINLAAEFPGILVGTGHSADKTEMQKFWQRADLMGRSAIRWDVTPCPETGKFFGEDPDRLARIMAHAGFLPQVEFVGRLRKRVAPINPADRGKPWREWQRTPKPIFYWLERDLRYRPLLSKNPHTGEVEPINAAARLVVAQLERYRDQLNLEIDLENRLVREAEEQVENFFAEVAELWQYYRHNLDQFHYRFLFNEEGALKQEYDESLKREMNEAILNQESFTQYQEVREASLARQNRLLQELRDSLNRLEPLLGEGRQLESDEDLGSAETELLERIAQLGGSLKNCSQESLRRLEDVLSPGSLSSDNGQQPEAANNSMLYSVLDRLVEDRALAKQAEISQMALAENFRRQFLQRGGLITAPTPAARSDDRIQLRDIIQQLGPFAIGVASLAGERGIAINRIFSNLFTVKGAWAGMAWQFGSSKRGTPVLSATFVDAEPIERKDAMLSFPYRVLTVTNYGDLKANPDLFFDNLHPEGYLIINTRKDPDSVRRELITPYDADTQEVVAHLRQNPGRATELQEWTSRSMYQLAHDSLPAEPRRQVRKLVAMACAHLVTVDMDGIIQEVTGSQRAVANLVAVAPIFKALQHLGIPLDLEDDRQPLLSGFPGAVLKNKTLLDHYLQAIGLALDRADGFPTAPALSRSPERLSLASADPSSHLMAMGGTIAGMILSQVATATHPICYVGFPITPAGNPFYAMAEAFANGHPYIYVDEVNPSEKVAAEKLIGIARTGGMLPVTFTASQGWRLFTEIIPQFVGGRLEGLFLITKRALAAPALNIEESHTDFMSFRDDGGLMLAPKSIQEYVPALYLARLMTHFAKLPVILSIGGITDTHKIGLVQVPPDQQVRSWLEEVFNEFDFLEHKLLNRQGETIVHGPSATAEFYQETQSEVERAHQAAMAVLPYAVEAVHRLTGYTFDELEMEAAGDPGEVETVLVLQGSLYPNAAEAVRELAAAGWRGIGCLSVRWFNPFPAEKLARALRPAHRVIVLDRSNSFGSEPPLASRVISSLARHRPGPAPLIHVLVGGLGGREITVEQMRELLLFAHLILHRPAPQETRGLTRLIREDDHLQAMLDELAALHLRTVTRHTRVPPHIRQPRHAAREKKVWRRRLERWLAHKDYGRFLTNYGAVAFLDAKEAMGETELLGRAVLRLEILFARRRLNQGVADLRRALLLLHYSEDTEDWRLAGDTIGHFFDQKGSEPEETLVRLLRSYAGKLVGVEFMSELPAVPTPPLSTPHSELSAPEKVSQEDAMPARPRLEGQTKVESNEPGAELLEFSLEEVELIRHWLASLVKLNGSKELFYNPEDFKRALIKEVSHDLRSQLYHPQQQPRAELVQAYESLYGAAIHRTLHREILVQDFAPELETIFEKEGVAALELVSKGVVAQEQAVGDAADDNETLVQSALAAARAYLQERVLPNHPKRPGFYMDYYQTVVEPELEEKIQEMLEAQRA